MKKLIINLLKYAGYGLVKVQGKSLIKRDRMIKIGNYRLEVPSNNPLGYTYIQSPDFSIEITRIVSEIFKKYPDMHAMDIGANIGDTFLRVKNVNEQISVACVEGDSFSFAYLKKNTSGFSNVKLFNIFLGEDNTTQKISFEKKGWNTTLIPDSKAIEDVEFVTLDFLATTQLENPNKIKFLKIDTEGYDTIILRGAKDLLRNAKPVIYMEYNKENMNVLNEDGLSAILSLKEFRYKKILFYDDQGRFMLDADLSEKSLITGLDSYITGNKGFVSYYNLCILTDEDIDVAESITAKEISNNLL